jgi:hypothetical protein
MKNTTKNILLAGLLCLVSSPVSSAPLSSAALATPADMARLRDMVASTKACKDAQNATNEAPAIIMVNTPENDEAEIAAKHASPELKRARNAKLKKLVRQAIAAKRPKAQVNAPEANVINGEEPELVDASVIDAEWAYDPYMLAAKALKKSDTDSDSSDDETEEKDTKSFLQRAKAKLLATKQAASAKVGAWYSGACDLADDTTVAIHDRSAAVATSLVGVAVAGKNKVCSLANATGRGIATAGRSARRALTSKPAKVVYGVTAAALVAYVAHVIYTIGDLETSMSCSSILPENFRNFSCNRFVTQGDMNASFREHDGTEKNGLALLTCIGRIHTPAETIQCTATQNISAAYNAYVKRVQEVIAADSSSVATAFQALPETMKEKITALGLMANGYIKPAFESVANSASYYAGSAWNATSTGLGSAWDSVRNLTSGLALRGAIMQVFQQQIFQVLQHHCLQLA